MLAWAGTLLLSLLLVLGGAASPAATGARALPTRSAAPHAELRGGQGAERVQVRPSRVARAQQPSLEGESSGLRLHRPLPPLGRGPGFQPGGWPFAGAAWARPALSPEALACQVRASTAPARAGYRADRPTIRTCPLRGPPRWG